MPGQPTKVTRKEKKQALEAVQKESRGKKTLAIVPATTKGLKFHKPYADARLARETEGSLVTSTDNPSIVIESPLDPGTLYGVAIAYTSHALMRGYLAFAESPDYPYHAAVYMTNVLIAYVNGSTPEASSLPLWLQQMGQALAPKRAPLGNGWVSYRFKLGALSDPYVPTSTYILGPGVYGNTWNAYKLGTGSVDGFPKAGAPAAYTAGAGKLAWASLAQFMVIPGRPDSRQVPLQKTSWSNNVSAFSFPAAPEGGGFNVVGGWFYQCSLEVPIFTPILGCFLNVFATGGGDTAPGRVSNYMQFTGGDALFASAAFSQLIPVKDRSMKEKPFFHFVDFLRFGDVVAQWATHLITMYMKDPVYNPDTAQKPADLTCPLSLQEMLILLKNEVMCLLGRSQIGVQALFPNLPTGAGDNQFTPYVCSSTTVPLKSVGMKLPQILIENLKGLMCRMVNYSHPVNNEKRKRRKAVRRSAFFCPVLGQYYLDELDSAHYSASVTFGADVAATVVPTFTTLAAVMRSARRDSKGNQTLTPMVEVPISLIDGTTATDYIFINDPTRLQSLANQWNEWLTQLEPYSTTLSTASSDLGVNVCESVSLTEHWIVEAPSAKTRSEEFVDLRIKKNKAIVNTVYSDRQAIAITSQNPVLSGPFDLIQKLWILPSNHSVTTQQGSISNYPRIALAMKETHTVASATEDAGISIAEKNSVYAKLMTKGKDAPASEIEAFFVDQAKQGHGGVLSGMVADFVGKVLGPGPGALANAVASVIPI